VNRTVGDGLLLAVGTLTILPTPPPRIVDRRSASWAMTLAPLVGVLLAVAAALWLWLLGAAPWSPAVSPPLAAALTVGLLAVLSRAVHLDGLADTADGLGSGRPAAQALDVMRRSDIGPFGVVTLVLVLLTQTTALAQHLAEGRGAVAVALALVTSRLVLAVVCLRGIPAARPEGLGRAVAGTVDPAQLLLALLATTVLLAAVVLGGVVVGATPGTLAAAAGTLLRGALVAGIGLLAGAATCWWCVRRLGGVTGDVLGACVEVTFTVSLVVLVLV
jgi:adenosylcobinamide-GDP ribazoletransferase